MYESELIISIIFHNIYTIFFVICQGFCSFLTQFEPVFAPIFTGFITNKFHLFKRTPIEAFYEKVFIEHLTFLRY